MSLNGSGEGSGAARAVGSLSSAAAGEAPAGRSSCLGRFSLAPVIPQGEVADDEDGDAAADGEDEDEQDDEDESRAAKGGASRQAGEKAKLAAELKIRLKRVLPGWNPSEQPMAVVEAYG